MNKIKLKDILTEATRQQLISKSRNADSYKDTSKGKNRYERRLKSRISTSVRDYNRIDMDAFWKGDILEFGIKVQGETNNYVVTITFEHILDELQREVKVNNNKLEFKCVLRSLLKVFNSDDVYVSCTCPDFKYTQAYRATKNRYNSGTPQLDNGMAIRNPNDTKGAGCKHILLVLSNTDWMMKIASVINNYIKYCKLNLQRNYADYIFPKVYGMPYKKAVQLSLFDDLDSEDSGLLPSDQQTLSNIIAKSLKGRDAQGKFTSENPYKFKKSELGPKPKESNALGLKFNNEKSSNIIQRD